MYDMHLYKVRYSDLQADVDKRRQVFLQKILVFLLAIEQSLSKVETKPKHLMVLMQKLLGILG